MPLTLAELKSLASAKERLASDVRYPSADAYYADRDEVHKLTAKSLGKREHEHNPMYFWFGRQSN